MNESECMTVYQIANYHCRIKGIIYIKFFQQPNLLLTIYCILFYFIYSHSLLQKCIYFFLNQENVSGFTYNLAGLQRLFLSLIFSSLIKSINLLQSRYRSCRYLSVERKRIFLPISSHIYSTEFLLYKYLSKSAYVYKAKSRICTLTDTASPLYG